MSTLPSGNRCVLLDSGRADYGSEVVLYYVRSSQQTQTDLGAA